VSAGDDYQSRRLLHAYHEAGHTLVGHVIGRCIEEVSIAVRYDGYGGYCRFNAFIEDANDHPEWRDDAGNPDLVTIYYAGMLATAYACVPHVTYDEEESGVAYLEGSERDDLEQIHKLLIQIGIDEQQRKTITDASWTRAQKILSEYWPAVDALATALLKRERLGGRAAHRLIWQTIGYPETDWRFQALSIKPRRA
jgi:ATP-dependent Zn protease